MFCRLEMYKELICLKLSIKLFVVVSLDLTYFSKACICLRLWLFILIIMFSVSYIDEKPKVYSAYKYKPLEIIFTIKHLIYCWNQKLLLKDDIENAGYIQIS